MPRLPPWLPAAVLALAPAPAAAQIVTDRPDVAESSLVVEEGVYQLEQGLAAGWEPGAPSLAFPSLHRVGLGSGLELRLETPIAELTGAGAAFQELALGGKWHVQDGGGFLEPPSLALLGHATVDRAGTLEPLLKLLVDSALPAGLGFALNLGARWPVGAPLPLGNFAVALSQAQGERLGLYGELWGAQALDRGPGLHLGGGATYLLHPDVQIDGAIYRGLTPGAEPWRATVGFSFRAR